MDNNINKLKKDNLKIPTGYFEESTLQILNRMKDQIDDDIKPVVANLRVVHKAKRIKMIWISGLVAASIAILIFMIIPGRWQQGMDSNTLSNEEIVSYLNQNVDNIDLELFANTDADKFDEINAMGLQLDTLDTQTIYDDIPLEEIINN